MKRIMLLFAFSVSLLVGCDGNYTPTADEKDAQRQEQMQKEAQSQTGLPAIHNYQEKKLLKQIYESRDNEKLICYAYLFNEFNGKLVFLGKCLGYGIPYSTQYSNPQKVSDYGNSNHYAYMSIPQCEPNGLFMPASSEGTWLMMIDSGGTPHPVYVEPRILVSPFKLN